MKFRLLLLILCVCQGATFAQLPLLTSPGLFPVKTPEKWKDSATLVRHDGYVSEMHDVYLLPLWVYHRISKQMLDSGITRERPSGYPADQTYTQLKRSMYDGSGYQHGHLAPAGDFKRDERLFRESHFMTNMAPQHGCLNEIGWCYLESMTRNWASEDSTTVTHVISGCITGHWIDSLCHPSGVKIYVPARFFKAILIEDTLHPERSRAIGFVVPNGELTREQAQEAACAIDEIERITQLDLFAGCTRLPVEMLAKLERAPGVFGWQGYKTECGSKKCESVYAGNRIHPSKRKKLWCN